MRWFPTTAPGTTSVLWAVLQCFLKSKFHAKKWVLLLNMLGNTAVCWFVWEKFEGITLFSLQLHQDGTSNIMYHKKENLSSKMEFFGRIFFADKMDIFPVFHLKSMNKNLVFCSNQLYLKNEKFRLNWHYSCSCSDSPCNGLALNLFYLILFSSLAWSMMLVAQMRGIHHFETEHFSSRTCMHLSSSERICNTNMNWLKQVSWPWKRVFMHSRY